MNFNCFNYSILNLLGRLKQWSFTEHTNGVSIDIFGLVNSLVMNCDKFTEALLDRLDILEDLLSCKSDDDVKIIF